MRFPTGIVLTAALLSGLACHRPKSAPAPSSAPMAERTVFTDSVMHAERCKPVEAGQDWRRVCIPLDQSERRVRPVPPPSR